MKLKSMGIADIKQILAGDDAGGQLQAKLPVDLVWDASNRWTIDTEDDRYSDVPEEWWEFLSEEQDILIVDEYKRVPINEHQRTFLGMKDGDNKTEEEIAAEAEEARRADAAARAEAVLLANATETLKQGEGATKEELSALADELGITGAGRSKASLINAIQDHVDLRRSGMDPFTGEAHTDSTVSSGGDLSVPLNTGGGAGKSSSGGTTPVGGST